jgi:hypothetical protein
MIVRVIFAALVAIGSLGPLAASACTLNVRIENRGAHTVGFLVTNPEVRGTGVAGIFGAWLGLWEVGWRPAGLVSTSTVTLAPGRSIGASYWSLLPCGSTREVKVPYQCLSGIYAATNFIFTATSPRLRGNLHTARIGGACR